MRGSFIHWKRCRGTSTWRNSVAPLAIFLALVMSPLLQPGSSASASPIATSSALKPKKNCRPPQPQPTFSELKVLRVSCSKARSIARAYLFGGCHPYGCTIQDFRCDERTKSNESYRVYCHRGNRVVRFDFGF